MLKEKILFVGVLGATLLWVIQDAIVKNTLVEDDNNANTFGTFNLTQSSLYLKNNCY